MINPLSDMVKVRDLADLEEDVGGVLVRQRASGDVVRAQVVACGSQVDLEVNAVVLVPRICGSTIEDCGEKYRFVRDDDVVAVVE